MKKLKVVFIYALLGLLSTTFVFAEELKTNDGSNDYILQIDNNGLGYDNNDPYSLDQSNEFILSGSIEVFDVGYDNETGGGIGDYRIKTGLQPTFEANVPTIATLSNNDGTLLSDRLLVTLNPQNNPTEANGTVFALQISTDNFATFNYINPTTFSADIVTSSNLYTYYRPCAQSLSNPIDAPRWDCGTLAGLKRYILGLTPNTTYYVRAIAMNGDLTNSEPGPSQSATTANSVLTMTLSNTNSSFGTLTPQEIKTATPDIFVEVNGTNPSGYNISINGQGNGVGSASGLYSTTKNHLIASTSSVATQSEGYGATAELNSASPDLNILTKWQSNTNNLVGQILLSPELFFTKPSNPNATGDRVKVKYFASIANSTPPANDYRDIITFILSPNF